jgi:hypothetical protein
LTCNSAQNSSFSEDSCLFPPFLTTVIPDKSLLQPIDTSPFQTPNISSHSKNRHRFKTKPSQFRPPVPAASRISTWSSPFSLRAHTSLLSTLPQPLVQNTYNLIRNSLAHNTRSTYGAGVLKFTQFCDEWGIEAEARVPASAELITAFVSEFSGKVSGNTICSWLAGIRSWHIHQRAPWNGEDEWVILARSAANKNGTAFKRSPRAPVSLEHLLVLRKHLKLSTPFHTAIWATALVTFFGCRRLGETTVLSEASFNPLHHVTHSSAKVLQPFLTFSLS